MDDRSRIEPKILDFPQKQNTKYKTGKYLFIVFIIALLFVSVFIGTDSSFHSTNEVKATKLSLSSNNNYEIAAYKDGYVIANDGKISCYNTNQELQWETIGSKTVPTIKVNGSYVLVYYNDDKVAVVTNGSKTQKIKITGNVLFGNINKNGYTVLFLKEAGLKNKITVYNNRGELLYYRDNPDNYITYALLSDDNYSLITNELVTDKNNVSSILNVTNIKKNVLISKIDFQNAIPAGFIMNGKKKIITVFETKMQCYSIVSGQKKWETSFDGMRLFKYNYNNGLMGCIFNKDDSSGSGSSVLFYNTNGKKVGTYNSTEKIHQLDLQDKNALLTMDRQIQKINTKGKQISSADITYDIKKVIFIGNKKCALILTNYKEAKLIQLD